GWTADGTLTGERFGAFSIRAQRLSGPASLRFSGGVLRLEAELDGEGGGGAAEIVAEMVGPDPEVQLAGEFDTRTRTLTFERIAMQSGEASAETSILIGLHPDAMPRLTLEGSAQDLPLSA